MDDKEIIDRIVPAIGNINHPHTDLALGTDCIRLVLERAFPFLDVAIRDNERKDMSEDEQRQAVINDLPEFIQKSDFIREFGKYMWHNVKLDHDRASEAASELADAAQVNMAEGNLVTALALSEHANTQKARAEAFHMCLSFMVTSTKGLDIDPEELNV